MDPTTLFKALSNSTRLRCMVLLCHHDELCVCELTHTLDLPQPKVSHHLAHLRRLGLVADRKEGLWVYYRLQPDIDKWVASLLAETAGGCIIQSPYREDESALAAMPNRPGRVCCA